MANFKNSEFERLATERELLATAAVEGAVSGSEDTKADLYNIYLSTQEQLSKIYPELFAQTGKYVNSPDIEEARRAKIRNLINSFTSHQGYSVPGMTEEQMNARLFDEIVDFSILTQYIADPDNNIEEINVNAWNDIEVRYSDGSVKKTEPFFTPDHADNIMRRLVRAGGSIIDEAMPMAEGSLSTNIRITALESPIVDKEIGIACSIRILRPQLANRQFFIDHGTLTEQEMAFLELAIRSGVSMIFVGATGAGKTTLMNYLLTTIDNNKRIVTIEHNARELSLIKRDENGNAINNVVHLKTRPSDSPKQNVSQEDLVVKALRLDPNVICVGEMRDSEAYAAQEASLTGHTVVSSLHADGVEATHHRIAMLALKKYNVAIDVALMQAAMAFPLIVYISKLEDNSRRVMQISECSVIEVSGSTMRDYNTLFEYEILSNTVSNGKFNIKGQHTANPRLSKEMIKTMMRGGATVADLERVGIIIPHGKE